MFSKIFTRKPRLADLERYVELEYRPDDRSAALERLIREYRL